MEVSYVKNGHQKDISQCPECGYILSGRAKSKRNASYSCPRLFSTVIRKKPVARTKYTPKEKEKRIIKDEPVSCRDPILCDLCKRRVTKCMEGFNVRPVFTGRETPRRQAVTSSYRNLIRDHYATRFKQHFYEVATSNELLSETESERFVRSTEYSLKKIEDDLKQKLLMEFFKPKSHPRHHYTHPPLSRSSSHKLRMIFLNEATDFNDLKRGSSDSAPAFSLEYNGWDTNSSAHTIVTQSCCDVPDNNCSYTLTEIDKHASGSPKPTLVKSSTFTKPNSKLVSKQNSNAPQSNMETQYSVIASRKKKKKWRKHPLVKEEIVLKNMTYETNMHVQTVLPKTHREPHLKYTKATRATKHTLKETGMTTESERLQTILEAPLQSRQPHEVVGQQVKCINPSCFLVNGCLLITRENTGTQYDVNPEREATVTEAPCKAQPTATNPRVICEKGCQYHSEQKLTLAPQYNATKLAYKQQPMIVQCHCQRQANKLIQSGCNHNPPCKLVPSCFRVKYKRDFVFGCI